MSLLPALGLGPRRAARRPVESALLALGIALGVVAVLTAARIRRDAERSFEKRIAHPVYSMVRVDQYGRAYRPAAVFGQDAFDLYMAEATADGVDPAWFAAATADLPHVEAAFVTYAAGAAARLSSADEWLTCEDSYISSAGVFDLPEMEFEAGRPFSEEEFRTGARVVVLGRDYARRLFGDADPLGKGIEIRPYSWMDSTYAATVVGVVRTAEGRQAFHGSGDSILMTKVYDNWGCIGEILMDDPAAVPAATDVLRARLEAGGPAMRAITAHSNYDFLLEQRRSSASFSAAVMLIGLAALAMAVLTAGSIFAARLPSYRAAIGILRALGADDRCLVLTGLSETIPILAAGVLLGLAGAVGLRAGFPPSGPGAAAFELADAAAAAAVLVLGSAVLAAQALGMLERKAWRAK